MTGLYVTIDGVSCCVLVQSFSSLLWAFTKMGIRPPTSYLDRASEVMERREVEGLQVCSSLESSLNLCSIFGLSSTKSHPYIRVAPGAVYLNASHCF